MFGFAKAIDSMDSKARHQMINLYKIPPYLIELHRKLSVEKMEMSSVWKQNVQLRYGEIEELKLVWSN